MGRCSLQLRWYARVLRWDGLRVREARYWKGRCFPLRSKVETTTMHDAMVTLLFMVIAMFPFLLSLQTPE